MAKKSFSRRSTARGRVVRWVLRKLKGIGSGIGHRRLARHRLVQQSSLFDAEWYLSSYPDVAEAGVDPLWHYMNFGWFEGRDPGPEFSGSAYLKANPDVARAGVNPLLHFIEFGRSEGRGNFGNRHLPLRQSISFDFATPAPCLSSTISDHSSVVWRRSYRFDGEHPKSVKYGDLVVGYAGDQHAKEITEGAFSLLRFLSGVTGQGSPAKRAFPKQSAEQLVDSWYVNSSQLRTRWSALKFPFAVRAYQHLPGLNGVLSLVGEGLVSTQLDIVDLHLKNAYFPILIVFAEPDGRLRGVRLLAFPSLCRGGVHYSELLHSAALERANLSLDPITSGEALAERLLLICSGQPAAVGKIVIDLERADGAGPMFQRDFRLWLEKIARISISPAATGALNSDEQLLANAVSMNALSGRSQDCGTLELKADMVPTIAALTELGLPAEGHARETVVPFLVAGMERTHAALLIDLPNGSAEALGSLPAATTAGWPRVAVRRGNGVRRPFPPAAIRLPRRKGIGQPELFMPVTDNTAISHRAGVTWLIEAKAFDAKGLEEAILALAMQSGARADTIAFVGPLDRRMLQKTTRLFPGRVEIFGSINKATANFKTELAGILRPGVILHDNRSAAIFASLLSCDGVATASCVLIYSEARGGHWHAVISDAGVPAAGSERLEYALSTGQLWRTSFPVAAPPSDLWVAQSQRVADWLIEPTTLEPIEGVHIVTSVVTATHSPQRVSAVDRLHVAFPSFDAAIGLKAYVG